MDWKTLLARIRCVFQQKSGNESLIKKSVHVPPDKGTYM